MSWLSSILHGRNADVSKTKVTSVVATVASVIGMFWPPLGNFINTHTGEVLSILTGLSAFFIKDAVDKAAPPGSVAAAPPTSAAPTK